MIERIIHIIPVGGKEPMHVCDIACWCHPIMDELNTITHNAEDCREARERFGRNRPDEEWVLVEQLQPTTCHDPIH